jgi:hypothetical protein
MAELAQERSSAMRIRDRISLARIHSGMLVNQAVSVAESTAALPRYGIVKKSQVTLDTHCREQQVGIAVMKPGRG